MRPTSQYWALAMRSVRKYAHLSVAWCQGCSVTVPTVECRGGGCGWWGQLVQGQFFQHVHAQTAYFGHALEEARAYISFLNDNLDAVLE